MTVTELTTDTFEDKTASGTWVIDFWAGWCGPCKQMKPIFESVSEEMEDINFGSVDIEDEQELAGEHGVRSIPTFLVMKDGEIVDRSMGAMPEDQFSSWIEDNA